MKRALAPLLVLALLAAQVVVPSAHELDVARGEASHHFCSGAGAKLAPVDAHEHHEEADCRVCLRFSQQRLETDGPSAPAPLAAASKIAPEPRLAFVSGLLPFAAPRGPPSA